MGMAVENLNCKNRKIKHFPYAHFKHLFFFLLENSFFLSHETLSTLNAFSILLFQTQYYEKLVILLCVTFSFGDF